MHINTSLVGTNFTITDQLGKVVTKGRIKSDNSVIEINHFATVANIFSIGGKARQAFKVIKN